MTIKKNHPEQDMEIHSNYHRAGFKRLPLLIGLAALLVGCAKADQDYFVPPQEAKVEFIQPESPAMDDDLELISGYLSNPACLDDVEVRWVVVPYGTTLESLFKDSGLGENGCSTIGEYPRMGRALFAEYGIDGLQTGVVSPVVCREGSELGENY